jgi:hypothetical protein
MESGQIAEAKKLSAEWSENQAGKKMTRRRDPVGAG